MLRLRLVILGLVFAWANAAWCDDPVDEPPGPKRRAMSQDPPGMTRLLPECDAWVDAKNKRVVVDGTVCLREGTLEMFSCLTGTKEHEAIVAANTDAYAVHAALIFLGAEPGTTAKFRPVYVPASGPEVDIELIWTDKQGLVHRNKAQDWIKDVKTGGAMQQPWVFAGSMFWEDEFTGRKRYMAESGDFICVSNFPTAMLDLPIESSDSDDQLLFTAYTERIPPIGTRVRMVLTPKLKAEPAADPKP